MNAPGPEGRIHWNGRKWPDRLHWQFDAIWLGEDPQGTWLAVPAGTPVRRGHEREFRLEHGFVMVVPPGAWWSGEFYITHPKLEVYVNIGTPCEWTPGAVRQVDLDLDVVRGRDGSVRLLDQDEFAVHRDRFGYPVELVEGALRAARAVTTMLEQHVEPFDAAAERWLRRLPP